MTYEIYKLHTELFDLPLDIIRGHLHQYRSLQQKYGVRSEEVLAYLRIVVPKAREEYDKMSNKPDFTYEDYSEGFGECNEGLPEKEKIPTIYIVLISILSIDILTDIISLFTWHLK